MGGSHVRPEYRPPLPRGGSGGGPGRAAPAHRGHALAREGARRRSVPGRAAGDDAGTGALLGDRVRLPAVGGAAERPAAVHDRDRRPRHPLHPPPVPARGRVAADHHPRLAGLGRRDAECRRPPRRPHRPRRRRRGCVPCGGAVDAGLRVLSQADRDRLGPGPHRACLDHPDAAPGLHAICGPGGRLGCADHRCDGGSGTAGAGGHSLQHARHGPTRGCEGTLFERARGRRPAAVGSVRRRTTRLRAAELPLHQGHRLCPRDGVAPPDVVWARRFAGRPGGLDAGPRRVELRRHRRRFRGRPGRQPHPRRGPGQHHPHLGDQHRGVLGSSLLGEHPRLLRRQGRLGPGGGARLPQRALPGPPQLDRTGLPQPHLLQPGRPRQPLRRLARTTAVHHRAPSRIPVTAVATVFGRVRMPSLGGATGWLNSEPLSPAELRGRVVVVNFWTLTCINWLRQEPYVRAWSQAYRADGLVVIGVHTPEFSFEHELDLVRQATTERAIDYPVAVDNDYEIWNAFANHYWPALYFVDADGVIRDQHFGEGRYEQSERLIQRLLGVEGELVPVEGVGVEAEADWDHLRTPETYLGDWRGERFAEADELADGLALNRWM